MSIYKSVFKTAIICICAFSLASCDDTTEDVGHTLVGDMDKLNISTDTFNVQSQSAIAKNVMSRTLTNCLGKIRDVETGAYLTCSYATQFHSVASDVFPAKDSITSILDNNVIADSCTVNIYYPTFYGDSTTTMKLNLMEMEKPMEEGQKYYSTFDPEEEGYIRKDGFNVSKSYSLADLSLSLADRNSSTYMHNIEVPLNETYKDRSGNEYNNFGTYLMREYFNNPENFSNSYKFTHDILPGVYVKSTGGLGAMAYATITQLNVYYKYTYNDSIYTGCTSFSGTEEVLTSTYVNNDTKKLEALTNDDACTYIKTPAGIYTELTLPVDEILKGHETDSINAAKLVLTCMTNSTTSKYNFEAPSTLLLLPVDSVSNFFEKKQIADYKTSFLTSINSTYHTYTFSNIGALVKSLYNKKLTGNVSANWNKVAVIPVETSYITVSSSSILSKVANDMSIKSTKLVKGTATGKSPIKISVIYSKFKEQ